MQCTDVPKESTLPPRSPRGPLLVLLEIALFLASAEGCELYPVALSVRSLEGAAPGTEVLDILNGAQPGNFGWLTWIGNPSTPTLVASLSAPGNSSTYVNPDDPADREVSVGDWIHGKPGVSNGKKIREALDALRTSEITVPVWDEVRGHGATVAYRVAAFARVRLLSYRLPGQNRISARFLGYVSCAASNRPPAVEAGPDRLALWPGRSGASHGNGGRTPDRLLESDQPLRQDDRVLCGSIARAGYAPGFD